jgi:hypothetical protein
VTRECFHFGKVRSCRPSYFGAVFQTYIRRVIPQILCIVPLILCGLSDLALLQGGLSDLIIGVSREAYSQLPLFDSERQIRVYFFILSTLNVVRRVNILNCCSLFYCIINCFNFGKEPVVCHNSRGV